MSYSICISVDLKSKMYFDGVNFKFSCTDPVVFGSLICSSFTTIYAFDKAINLFDKGPKQLFQPHPWNEVNQYLQITTQIDFSI